VNEHRIRELLDLNPRLTGRAFRFNTREGNAGKAWVGGQVYRWEISRCTDGRLSVMVGTLIKFVTDHHQPPER
jgi:hypothetical protein